MKFMEKVVVLLILFPNFLVAQSPNSKLAKPVAGERCPGFIFQKIDFYEAGEVSLAALRGKWVILDFWSRYCSGCIGSFPKISREQEQFRGKVQFIMVAPDSGGYERKLYSVYHDKLKLNMPSAFDDALFKSFDVGLLPHLVVINPNGLVRAITSDITMEQLQDLVSGKLPVFRRASFAEGGKNDSLFNYDAGSPFLINGNGGKEDDFLYRSILSQWKPGHPTQRNRGMDLTVEPKRYELLASWLDLLYNAAYTGVYRVDREDTALYGKYFRKPVFEIKDTSILRYDFATGKNLFCYSLVVPPDRATKEFKMKVMQSDLKNYFGYDVSVERRLMPYWKLVATPDARERLKSRGQGKLSSEGSTITDKKFKNFDMYGFVSMVEYMTDITRDGSPLLDETDIQSKIDIELTDWVKGDLDLAREALRRNGLDLVQGRKEMNVIVVRDPMPENQGMPILRKK